jgi:Kdo2-lipid IVA lauroyltransferase/acyltransferase
LNDDREHAGESASLARFWKPRHWPVWGLWLWMRLNAALPLGLALAVHRLVGKALYRLAPKLRRVVQRNLGTCFPELEPRAVEALAKRHFEALAMSIAECAAAWFGSARDGRFDIVGLEHLNAAVALGRGVILYTGHFTTLEICGQPFKRITPRFAAMFSHRSSPLLEEIQQRGRLRLAHEVISSDSVRAMLRSLKKGAVIWYAPDLMYRDGVLIPFFGEPAMTNVATSKIARLSGATVLPFAYRRLDRGARYEIRFYAPLAGFPSGDAVEDTRRLVPYLEQFIRACPEQYQWIQKRFKGRPAELPDLYASRPRS